MAITSFFHYKKIYIFWKSCGCGLKIGPVMPSQNWKLKWAWRAWFLSYALYIFKFSLTLRDTQMILVRLFEISICLRFSKTPPGGTFPDYWVFSALPHDQVWPREFWHVNYWCSVCPKWYLWSRGEASHPKPIFLSDLLSLQYT